MIGAVASRIWRRIKSKSCLQVRVPNSAQRLSISISFRRDSEPVDQFAVLLKLIPEFAFVSRRGDQKLSLFGFHASVYGSHSNLKQD